MRTHPLLLLAVTLGACTDPFAGEWQSHGTAEMVGDFEIFLDADLVGRVDMARRTSDGTLLRVDKEAEAALVGRENAIWSYEVNIEGAEDLDCEIARKTEELTCQVAGIELEFEPYEEDDTTCNHSVCNVGRPLKTSCNACTAQICALDKFCCKNAWDAVCRTKALADCSGTTCPGG
jgi:hypothetical protein